MKNNPELINILKAELTLLTKDILKRIHKDDINALYKTTRKLYEKILVIKHLSDQLSQEEILEIVQDTEIVKDNFPDSKSEVLENKEESYNTEKEEDTPKKDTAGQVYKDVSKMKFVEKSKKHTDTNQTENTAGSLPKNTTNFKKMSIGLNDRIAFINNLFDKDADAYARHIESLNKFESYEQALQYIQQELKPKYHNWEGKDEYEFRLLQLLELKFS